MVVTSVQQLQKLPFAVAILAQQPRQREPALPMAESRLLDRLDQFPDIRHPMARFRVALDTLPAGQERFAGGLAARPISARHDRLWKLIPKID